MIDKLMEMDEDEDEDGEGNKEKEKREKRRRTRRGFEADRPGWFGCLPGDTRP